MTMPFVPARLLLIFAALAIGAAMTNGAWAQAGDPIRLAQLFGQRQEAPAQGDLSIRLDRLENQIRQLTGVIEELQHRNQQLEQQLRKMQQDVEFRFQEMGPSGRPPAGRPQSGALPGSGPAARPGPGSGAGVEPGPAPSPPPGRRADVFDPTTAPNAPGAPRTLGSMPPTAAGPDQGPGIMAPGAGEPVRRPPGAPLDLGSLAGAPKDNRGPPPPGAVPEVAGPGGRAVGPQAVLAPSGSAKDEYDLAYGYILRRDYALAEQSFRTFLQNHPDDRTRVPEANYWLGESLYQRQKYNDSAEIFLDLYNKYPNSLKAPDALLRLGQSLAALGKQDAACASLGAVLSKYPKASANVKRSVEQEQKRVRC